MKYSIPVGTFILLGAIVCVHRSAVPDQAPQRVSVSAAPVLHPGTAEVAERPPVALNPRNMEQATVQDRPAAAAMARPEPRPHWRKLCVSLERDLRLTPIQLAAVEAILKEREEEILKCHEGYRRSGVFDMQHYEWWVVRMKADWYRKIDFLLDAVQHERFVAIVEKGFFNDGLVFTHEPGMTVLD